MYKICFYVPETHLEEVKNAMFDAGAGKFRNYDKCSWEVEGTGQFRPLKGSSPFIGAKDVVEKIREFRVEMLCVDDLVEKVLKVLIEGHPYEEPAYDAVKIFILDNLK